MARWETAGSIINQVGLECGLATVADPYTSTDSNYVKLVGLLTAAGRELSQLRQWPQLQKIHTITTTGGDTGKYDLPTDFGGMIAQTHWNKTTKMPLTGPITGQLWEGQVGGNTPSTTVYLQFREMAGQLWVYPWAAGVTVPAGQVITFEYVSRYWVCATGAPTTLAKDAPTLTSDVVFFDPLLIQRLLKYKWQNSVGLDSTKALEEYEDALDSYKSRAAIAPILNLNGLRTSLQFIGDENVPETGFGT